jgi:hypothetical protein
MFQMAANGVSPDDQLQETFVRWYPGMQTERETEIEKKAAQPRFECSP